MEGRFSDMRLVSFLNGTFTFEGPIIQLMAEYMAQMLKPDSEDEAANYTETQVTHDRLGYLIMTIQRASGKTPHQLRRAAEAEERLDMAVAGFRDGSDPDRVPSQGDPRVLRAHMRALLDQVRPAEPDEADPATEPE